MNDGRRPGGDGGASSAAYGSMASGAAGAVLVYGFLMVAVRLYVALWPITVPATAGYFLWYYPSEVWLYMQAFAFHAFEFSKMVWRWYLGPAVVVLLLVAVVGLAGMYLWYCAVVAWDGFEDARDRWRIRRKNARR